jgi:hypothetical protein
MTSRDQLKHIVQQNIRDMQPVVEELRACGFSVDSISDLHNFPHFYKRGDYPRIVPILLRFLETIENEDVKAAICSSLHTRWTKAGDAIPLLLHTLGQAETSILREAAAEAIRRLAPQIRDEGIFAQILEFTREPYFGLARAPLVLALGRVKHPRVLETLLTFLDDPFIAGSAIIALGELNSLESRPYLVRFVTHPDPELQRVATRALAKIEKAADTASIPRLSPPPGMHPLEEEEHEASSNFDLDDLTPLFTAVGECVDRGFGPPQFRKLIAAAEEMDVEDTREYTFNVQHGGRRSLLRARIFMDDVDAPDVAFFAPPELAAAIQDVIERFQAARGR